MKSLFFIPFVLSAVVSNSIRGQIPLPQLVYNAEKTLLARFVDHSGDSLFFISKEFRSNSDYSDTIILLQSQVFTPKAITKEKEEKINNNIIAALRQSKELLLFVHHIDGQLVFPIHSGIRILLENEVRWTNGPLVYDDSDFIAFPEKITGDEMLQRVADIEDRFKSVYALYNIKNPRQRNKELFQWLDDHMTEFHKQCDFNADCGWGGFQDVVLRWIIDGNILEDTWKVGVVYDRIYAGKVNSFRGFLGTFMDPSAVFKSEEGLSFLLEKALNEDQPIVDRQHSLTFMLGALSFILQDTFQNDPYFNKQSQAERQQDLLDQLMPLMYDDRLAAYAFFNIFRLSHSEVAEAAHRINLSKLPEMMQIYKTQPPANTLFRERFTDFLLASCTVDQWKSITGNDTLLHVSLHSIYIKKLRSK